MAEIKNRYEFLSAILEALDQNFTKADVKDKEIWRSKVLEGLGQTFDADDLKQIDKWRAKVVDGIRGMSSGGGSGGFPIAHVTLTATGIEPDSGNSINIYPELSSSRGNEVFALEVSNDGYYYNGDIILDEYNTSIALEYMLLTSELYITIDGGTVTNMSGDIVEEDGAYKITGDCIIDISCE